MACPHGNGTPASCSQCAGAVVRKVELVGGRVVVDGVAVKTTADQMDAAEETMMRKPALRRGGRAHRLCGICRQPGHNAKTCRRGL